MVNFSNTIPFAPVHQALIKGIGRVNNSVKNSSDRNHTDHLKEETDQTKQFMSLSDRLEAFQIETNRELRYIQNAINALPHNPTTDIIISTVSSPSTSSPRLDYDECNDTV